MREVEKPRPVTLQNWLLARLMAVVVRLLCSTLRLSIEGEEKATIAVREFGGALFVTWHGRTMVPIDYFRGRGKQNYYMLVSLSRDGDFLSEYLKVCRLHVIRGSTNRRGATAAREALARLAEGGIVAFTPDGPRGPAEVAQPGVVYFALKSGKPIIPAGIAASPCWETGSWDRFMVPRPFARVAWVYGDPVFVREGESLEEAAQRVTGIINDLQAEAEARLRPRKAGTASDTVASMSEDRLLNREIRAPGDGGA